VDPASVSATLNGKCKTIKAMRVCFVHKIMEHLEEINEQNRIRSERDRINAEKAAAYDAIMAEQEAKRKAKQKAEERVAAQKAKLEALRRQIEEANASMSEAEAELSQYDD
jgi:chromosome segregation ATPase